MTEPELADLERLCEAATPGPWEVKRCTWADEHFACGICMSEDSECDIVRDTAYEECQHMMARRDADLIAASRTALPALIAEVRRLRSANGSASPAHGQDVSPDRPASDRGPAAGPETPGG